MKGNGVFILITLLFGYWLGSYVEHRECEHEIKLAKQYYSDYCEIQIDNALTMYKSEHLAKKNKAKRINNE